MSKNRVTEYHIARLSDKRPEIRLDAIHQLVLLDSVEALDKLKEVYENDAEPEVRKAAQKAGRDIFLKDQATRQQSS